jgi:O-antigen ligase
VFGDLDRLAPRRWGLAARQAETLTRKLGGLERPFVVLALFLFSGGLIPQLRKLAASNRGAVEGDPVPQMVYAGIYLVALALLVSQKADAIRLARRAPLIWGLVALAAVSALWSGFPTVTIRRSLALLGSTLFGLYLALRFRTMGQLRLLAAAFGVAATLSLALALLVPAEGVMNVEPHLGAWRGVFGHKNTLGRIMVLAATVLALCVIDHKNRRSWYWAAWGLAVILVLLSRSVTALTVLTILIVVFLTLSVKRVRNDLVTVPLIAAMVVAVGGSLWAAANPGTIQEWLVEPLSVIGKERSLIARSNLWSDVVDMLRQRPWLGYGYGAFWLSWDGPSGQIWARRAWLPPRSHSGYLDLWLELGLVGLALCLAGVALVCVRAARFARPPGPVYRLWPLLFLTSFLLFSLMASFLLTRNNIAWVLYVATFHSLSLGKASVAASNEA